MAFANQRAGIEGLENVLAGFWKVKGSTARGAERGLQRAGAYLLAESKKLCPVEFGPLKASGYVRKDGSGFQTVVTVGYTASYALAVHEKIGMVLQGIPRTPNPPHKGRYWDPQGQAQAKFLEAPARALVPQMRRLVYEQFIDFPPLPL